MTVLAQLRDLRRRLAESDRLRSTVDHASDVAALDALLAAADERNSAERRRAALLAQLEVAKGASWVSRWARYGKAVLRLTEARARIDAILRGES